MTFELVINLKTAKALASPCRLQSSPEPTRSSNEPHRRQTLISRLPGEMRKTAPDRDRISDLAVPGVRRA